MAVSQLSIQQLNDQLELEIDHLIIKDIDHLIIKDIDEGDIAKITELERTIINKFI